MLNIIKISNGVLFVLAVAAGGFGAGATWGPDLHRSGAPASTHVEQLAVVTPQPPHTVSWYRAHRDEAKTTNARCDDNPGLAIHSADCLAADMAR